jgi:hypothetical protein
LVIALISLAYLEEDGVLLLIAFPPIVAFLAKPLEAKEMIAEMQNMIDHT